jgi:hypothetical protein
VSNVAYPPRVNPSVREKTGLRLSIGPPDEMAVLLAPPRVFCHCAHWLRSM